MTETEDLQTRTATVARLTDLGPRFLLDLEDGTRCAIPAVIDPPEKGTEIEIKTLPYRLPPNVDPDQIERHRTIRVVIGDVTIRCAEFDELIEERDRLREALRSVRDRDQQQPTPRHGFGDLADRLRAAVGAALDQLRSPTPSQPQQQTPGPFPGGAPPWMQGQGGASPFPVQGATPYVPPSEDPNR